MDACQWRTALSTLAAATGCAVIGGCGSGLEGADEDELQAEQVTTVEDALASKCDVNGAPRFDLSDVADDVTVSYENSLIVVRGLIGGYSASREFYFTPGAAPLCQLSLFALGGNDRVRMLSSIPTQFSIYVSGGAGNDQLVGGPGRDVFFGGAGWDVLLGKGADDFLNGGDGNDFLEGDGGADALQDSTGSNALIADGLSFATHVKPVLDSHCGGCHAWTHSTLVNVASNCDPTMDRVEPGSRTGSLLWRKTANADPCGAPMPYGTTGLKRLDPGAFLRIEQWIVQGARDN